MDLTERALLPATFVVITLTLSGCGGGTGSDAGLQQSTSTVTSTATVTPRPAASSPTSPPSSSSGVSTDTSDSAKITRCTGAVLEAKVLKIGVGGGSSLYTLGLRNTGSTECTLRGFPGVSMVAGSSGTQIGASAQTAMESLSLPVKLGSGESATFELSVAQAANYPPQACQPTAARGLRIYPPGSKQALFLPKAGLVGCANKDKVVLIVGPVE